MQKLTSFNQFIQDPPDRGAHAVPDVGGQVAGLRDPLPHPHFGPETRVGKVEPQPRLPRRFHAGQYGAILLQWVSDSVTKI